VTLKKLRYPVFILALAMLACGPLQNTSEPESQEASVATIVAATLEAADSEPAPTRPVVEDVDISAPEPTIPPPTQTPEPIVEPPTPAALKVIYIADGNVWLWTEGRAAAQLTTAGNVIDANISPDGEIIALIREYEYFYQEIWGINSEGSNERILVSRADFEAMPRAADYYITQQPFQVEWVPNSHTLAFNTNPTFEGPGLFSNDDLYLLDTDTGVRTHLLDSGFGGMFFYSPDGAQIALVTPESLSLINSDGTNRREILTFPIIYTYSEWAFYPTPVWAADSSYLRVAIPPQDPLGNPEAFTFIWHIPADGSLPYMAGEFISAPVFRGHSLISPDTLKAIYAKPIGEAFEQFELRHRDLVNGEDTIYTTMAFFLENWSPDSTRFTFSDATTLALNLGELGNLPGPATDGTKSFDLKWVSADRILFFDQPSPDSGFYLHLGSPGGTSIVIAGPFDYPIAYDFAQ
jgi:hypothetical protein